jgi:ADP-ribose pyrophosphatase
MGIFVSEGKGVADKWHQFSSSDVDLVEKELAFNGFFKVFKYHLKHRMFAGGWTSVITREVLERGHAVALLPYDPNTHEFVMIEQFRVGALQTSNKPWLLEIVAGMIDEGESETDVCRREAQEEAGIEVRQLLKLTDYLPSPGGTTERLHIYLGIVDATNAQGVHGLEYENEDILVHKVSESEAYKLLINSEFDNSATIIALQWFFLHKKELLAQLILNEV